jgi:PAS domain S-box-containing protein
MSALPHDQPPVDFRDVVERLPLVPYVDRLDEISTAVYIGPQIEELTGYGWEAFRADQQLFLRLVHPDDRQHYLDLVERRNRDNVPASGEYRLVRRDGRVVWVQDHEQVVEDARGRPVAAQGYLLDITEGRSQRARLEAINTVLAAFSAGASNEELVRTGLDVLADAIPGLRFSYVSVDDGGNLHLLHSAGRSTLPPIAPRTIAGGELSRYLEPLRRGETVSSPDGSRAGRFGTPFETFGSGDVGAFLDVPIRHAGRLVGIICGDAPSSRTFDADDVTTLKELGRQLAVTLERERAETDLRRRDEILSSVSRGAAVVMAGA